MKNAIHLTALSALVAVSSASLAKGPVATTIGTERPPRPPLIDISELQVTPYAISVAGTVVTITDDSAGDRLYVNADGVLSTYASQEVSEVDVLLSDTGGAFYFRAGRSTDRLIDDRRYRIQGNSREDTIDIDLWRNGRNEVVHVASRQVFQIDTDSGQDSLEISVGFVDEEGRLEVNADLGSSNDNLFGAIHGSVDGRAAWSIRGGDHADELFVDFRGTTHVGPQGALDLWMDGGHHFDVLDVEYQGIVQGDLDVFLYGDDFYDIPTIPRFPDQTLADLGKGEGDIVKFNAGLTEGSDGDLRAAVLGGLGDDKLLLQVIAHPTRGASPHVAAELSGGLNDDGYYATGSDGLPGEPVDVDNTAETFEPAWRATEL